MKRRDLTPSLSDSSRIEACARSPFKNVRLYALERIAHDDHPRRDDLLVALLSDREPAVVVEAVRVAGVLQCEAALPRLLQLLRSGDEQIAVQAAVSLGELGHYGELAPETREAIPEPPPLPAESPLPGRPPMSDPAFYLLFLLLSAGLFLSGYFFRMEMERRLDTGRQAEGSR